MLERRLFSSIQIDYLKINLIEYLKHYFERNLFMQSFHYVDGRLFAEDVEIKRLSQVIGTPFYCYSSSLIESQFMAFSDSVKNIDAEVCYSVKANSNLAVIATLAKLGAGADVVSLGELKRALVAGIPAKKIIFSGVGKTAEELKAAVHAGIKQINVESEAELKLLSDIAILEGSVTNAAIRVNPDIDAETHEKITTGKSDNKFGIDFVHAQDLFSRMPEFPGVNIDGIAVHIGSQLTSLEPFRRSYERVVDFVRSLRSDGFNIENLDLGGGLGVRYFSESPPDMEAYIKMVEGVTTGLNCQITFEPGRVIVGDAGILVSKVIYVKQGSERVFCVVDAAMNDLIRPTLYDAYHNILMVERPQREMQLTMDVVGPICESGDYFAKGRKLPALVEGDLIAICTVGAYGAVMSSSYNSRPIVPEVMVKNNEFSIIRERVSIDELMRFEKLPSWANKKNI